MNERKLEDPNVEGFKIVTNMAQYFWDSNKKEFVNRTEGSNSFEGGFMVWPAAVAVQSIVDAARINPNYVQLMHDALQCMDKYFNSQTKGFSPTFGGDEFYSDDSAQVVLCYLTAYEVCHEKRYLDRAVEGLQFLMGMADHKQGGVLWKMNNPGCNTCSTAECGMAAALAAKYISNNEAYIKFGYYCFDFVFKKMLHDGLIADGFEGDEGQLNTMKWTYNQGTPLTLCAHMFSATKDERFYEAAHELAKNVTDTNYEIFDRDTNDHKLRHYRDSLKFYQLLAAGLADYLLVFGDCDQELSQRIVETINRHLFFVFKFMAFPNSEGVYHGNLCIYDIDSTRREIFNKMTGESKGGGDLDKDEYKNADVNAGFAPNLMSMGAAARVFFQSARVLPKVGF